MSPYLRAYMTGVYDYVGSTPFRAMDAEGTTFYAIGQANGSLSTYITRAFIGSTWGWQVNWVSQWQQRLQSSCGLVSAQWQLRSLQVDGDGQLLLQVSTIIPNGSLLSLIRIRSLGAWDPAVWSACLSNVTYSDQPIVALSPIAPTALIVDASSYATNLSLSLHDSRSLAQLRRSSINLNGMPTVLAAAAAFDGSYWVVVAPASNTSNVATLCRLGADLSVLLTIDCSGFARPPSSTSTPSLVATQRGDVLWKMGPLPDGSFHLCMLGAPTFIPSCQPWDWTLTSDTSLMRAGPGDAFYLYSFTADWSSQSRVDRWAAPARPSASSTGGGGSPVAILGPFAQSSSVSVGHLSARSLSASDGRHLFALSGDFIARLALHGSGDGWNTTWLAWKPDVPARCRLSDGGYVVGALLVDWRGSLVLVLWSPLPSVGSYIMSVIRYNPAVYTAPREEGWGSCVSVTSAYATVAVSPSTDSLYLANQEGTTQSVRLFEGEFNRQTTSVGELRSTASTLHGLAVGHDNSVLITSCTDCYGGNRQDTITHFSPDLRTTYALASSSSNISSMLPTRTGELLVKTTTPGGGSRLCIVVGGGVLRCSPSSLPMDSMLLSAADDGFYVFSSDGSDRDVVDRWVWVGESSSSSGGGSHSEPPAHAEGELSTWKLLSAALGGAVAVLLIVVLGALIALGRNRRAAAAGQQVLYVQDMEASQPGQPQPQAIALQRLVPQLGQPLLSAPTVYYHQSTGTGTGTGTEEHQPYPRYPRE